MQKTKVTPFQIPYLQLPVKDPVRSAEFYKNIFGMEFSFPYNPGDGAAYMIYRDNVAVGLIECDEVPSFDFMNKNGEQQAVITFEINDIHTFYKELQSQGIETEEMTFKPDGGYNFIVRDPDGHALHVWSGWPEEVV
jgi:predicted enzyme related to lactoylglutathione lyase